MSFLARGICPICKTGMTALSDETGIPETHDCKCFTCKWGRVLIEVMKDSDSDTVVPTHRVLTRKPMPLRNATHEHVVDPVAFRELLSDLARLDDPEDVADMNHEIVTIVFGWRWIGAWRDYKKPDGSIAEDVPDLARQFLRKGQDA